MKNFNAVMANYVVEKTTLQTQITALKTVAETMLTEFNTAVTEGTTAGLSGEDWGTTDGNAPTAELTYAACQNFVE